MYNTIKLNKNYDDTYELLVYCHSKLDTEFGLDFLSRENIKKDVDSVLKYIRVNANKIKVNSVKIIVGGIVIATIPFTNFFNVYGTDVQKYSMAYLYSTTSSGQISDIDKTNNAINTVSPSYFNIQADGSLQIGNISSDLINYCHSKGLKVIPFLSNHWDKQAGIAALNNADNMTTDLANYIVQYNLDGINIDIENVTEAEKNLYTNFVAKLRSKLPNTKEISVAVAANPNSYITGWHGSYDYTGLANNSNYIMVMAYDEHWQGSAPGPIASITFVENSIKYATSKTSTDKIVLGIPFYGRIWSDDSNFNGNGVTLDKVSKLISDYGATVTYDGIQQSPKATFTVKSSDIINTINGKTLIPGTYTIWYENETSIQHKLGLVTKYGLKGTAVWAIGQEPSTIWQNYSSWLNPSSTPTIPNITPSITPEQTVIKTGTVNTNILNVRSSPSTNSKILTTLKKNDIVNIYAANNGWYTIRLSNGQNAYISDSYVNIKNNSTNTAPTSKTGIVTTTTLNVRSGPSTKTKIMSSLKKNTSVTIISTNNGWHTIKLSNGQIGYVSGTYVKLNSTSTSVSTGTSTTTSTKTGIVNTSILNVRSGPSTGYKVISNLRKNTTVSIISTSGGWHKIKLSNGQIGYISSSYVSIK
ncbi:MAG: SH3 domain-containing protein [Clostridia bacterium]|nr:SH3 domain-containing protein [Clostridia bacterium]